jgi:transposase
MLTPNLSPADIEKLNYERFHYPCPRVQKRLHAVYLKHTLGGSNLLIGSICDLHYNSVGQWLQRYQNEGIEALFENHYGHQESALQIHQAGILASFRQQAPVSSNEAVARIQALTHITRSPTSVRNWMHKNGLKFRKMGHLPAKVNVSKQAQWLEQQLTPVIEKAKKGQCHLFFMDAAHFVPPGGPVNPYLCAVWCLARLFIKAPAGRQRLNVVGAVQAITKQIVTLCNDTYVNGEVIAQFLRKLRAEFADLPLVIVLDNARYQHCQFIEQLAKELGIELLFLPPYSPNLNIIERLWKMTKKHCLYAKYYENFNLFSSAITKGLNSFSQEQLEQTLTLKFQTFENAQFYPV